MPPTKRPVDSATGARSDHDLVKPRRSERISTVRIAVIGSGVAGLTCAHVLGPRHDVVLYEADARLGGHANTVEIEDPAAGALGVDTGFIVHNDRNYPNLVRLFAELGVATQPSEMSFCVHDPAIGFSYRATNPNTLLADRRNVLRRDLWQMLWDIRRFWRDARVVLEGGDETTTLAAFLDNGSYSRPFVDLHLIPMGAAVWSADPSRFGEFPARSLFRFLDNHGLLGVRDRPRWRTVIGGSRTYVDAVAVHFTGTIHLDEPVRSVRRDGNGGAEVTSPRGTERFDHVILASHTDQSLAMLIDATPEKDILGAIDYQPNRATLHTDTGVLSPQRRAWAAWNYRREPGATVASVTYDLTCLQRLPGSRRYLVSLNMDDLIDPSTVLRSFDYTHPVFDLAAMDAQRRLPDVNGARGVSFCGAWAGYGFHEDGMVSALDVCRRLGVNW
jgi:predicted NAD/FAD-binding protein